MTPDGKGSSSGCAGHLEAAIDIFDREQLLLGASSPVSPKIERSPARGVRAKEGQAGVNNIGCAEVSACAVCAFEWEFVYRSAGH